MATTLSEVRTLALQRAGMQNAKIIKTPEANHLINSARRDLWTLFVAHSGAKSLTSDVEISTVNGTIEYDIPRLTDSNLKEHAIYSIERIGIHLDNHEYPARKVPFSGDVFDLTPMAWDPGTDFRYVLKGIDEPLVVLPIANAVYTIRVWAVWWPTVLTDEADEFEDALELPWLEYIITQAAIQFRRKEESDTAGLERDKADIVDRLMRVSEGVDQAGASRIIDATRRRFSDGRLF